MLERAAVGSGNSHHVAKRGEDDARVLRERQGIINAPHGKHAHRAARTMNQLDIRRENILQTEAVNRMGVSAANFHQPVMAVGVGQAPDFLRRSGDQLRVAKLVHKFHDSIPVRPVYGECLSWVSSSPYPRTSCIAASLSPSISNEIGRAH